MQMPPEFESNFNANIKALETVDPELARKLSQCTLPDDLEPTATFDGVTSFRSSQLSPSGWFAHTGMPTVGEHAIVDKFDFGGANPLLPGCGQGYGLGRVLDKITDHQTVFVWEPELLHLALLLRIHDFSHRLLGRNLVFLYQSDLGDSLIDFFADHTLLSPPAKMLAWPSIDPERMQELSARIEHGVGEISLKLRSAMVETVERVGSLEVKPITSHEPARVLITSLAPHPASHRFACDLGWGLEKLGHTCCKFLLDEPEHASSLALGNTLAEFQPQAVISVGLVFNDWPVRPPAQLPFASVIALPEMTLAPALIERLRPAEHEVFLAGENDVQLLADTIPAEQLAAIDLAVNPASFVPIDAAELADRQRCDLLFIADVVDLDPQRYGIGQKSHQTLWRHLVAEISRAPLSFSTDRADELLKRACRQTRIELSEEQLFEAFVDVFRRRLIPSAGALTIARQLIKAGFKLAILGAGWDGHADLAPLAQPMPKESSELNRLINASDMVMCIDYESNWRTRVFNSLCAARPVIVSRLAEDKTRQVGPIREAIVYLSSGQDLVRQIKDASRRLNELEASALRAREYLIENHSFEKLAQMILTRCRVPD